VNWQEGPAWPEAQRSQFVPAKPSLQRQVPSGKGAPWLWQSMGIGVLQSVPVKPGSHEHVPSVWGVPWPWQVSARENSHSGPA
jgi:hypothetical protein